MPVDTAQRTTIPCFILCAVLLLLPTMDAQAQIELTADEARALVEGTTEVDSYGTATAPVSALQGLVQASGENQTYDITAAAYEQTLDGSVELLMMPADVPGADDPALSDAEVVLAYELDVEGADLDSTAWVFQDFDDDGVYRHGITFRSTVDLDGDGSAPDDVKLTSSPRDRTLALPLTFETSWTNETTQTISIGAVTVDNTISTTAEVDGYGTLVTPAGEAPCLRIHRVRETTSFGTTTTTESFEFVTETGLSATITLGASGQVISSSYSVMSGTGTDIEPTGAEVPSEVHLDQNYPNPFNPKTTIRYEVPEATHVRLTVYDMLGREVEVLVDRQQPAGTYRATFGANDLPSGVYLYQLDAGTPGSGPGQAVTQTRRMLLLK